MFGIEIKIGSTRVQNIRDFLLQVKEGNFSLTFDPNLHCFQKETDTVIQKLIQVILDEKVYVDGLSNKSDLAISTHILLIPPSSWEQLVPLLTSAPLVKLAYDGTTFEGLHLSNATDLLSPSLICGRLSR